MEFENKLRQLNEVERKILQCLSVIWEPIQGNDIQKLIKLLGVRKPDGRVFAIQDVSQFRYSLIGKGLLFHRQESWGSGYEIADKQLQEFLIREVKNEGWLETAIVSIQAEYSLDEFKGWYYRKDPKKFRILRDYRFAIYQKNTEEAQNLFKKIVENEAVDQSVEMIQFIFSNPFQSELLKGFDKQTQADILAPLFDKAMETSVPGGELWDFVDEHNLSNIQKIKSRKVERLIFQGNLAEAKKVNGEPTNLADLFYLGTIACLEKDFSASVGFFEEANKLWRKLYSKKKGYAANWQLFFYGLSLSKVDEPKFHKFAEEYSDYAYKNYSNTSIHRSISAISYYLRNNDKLAETAFSQINPDILHTKLIQIITAAIIPNVKVPNYVEGFAQTAKYLRYFWIEFEAVNLLKSKGNLSFTEDFEGLQKKLKFEPAGNIFPPIEEWERALNLFEMIAQRGDTSGSKAKLDETRIAWLIDFSSKDIQPVEQKFSKKGWTDGRNIALKRLYEHDVKKLTEQDNLVVNKSLSKFNDGYYYNSYSYEFEWKPAIEALIGHPYLFLMKNPSVNVQLNRAEPNLIIKEVGENLELSFDTKITDEGIIVKKETETRYKVFQVTKNHVDIANSLKDNRLRVPPKGREALLKAIQPLTKQIVIQSDLEEHFENLPSVEADSRIHALITPAGEGFHLEFFAKPFGKIAPYFKPGKGAESVIADLDNVRTRTKRDLKKERKLVAEIEELCPFLADFESPNYDWNLADPEACLTALSELEKPRTEGKLAVEWTKGQKLKLLGNINFENFALSVKGSNTWFEVEGKVKVNEDLVLSMRELSKLLTTANTNFIELSDGQFIAITEKLRKHLQSLNAVMDDKGRLHNLRSGILEDFADELENFKADKAWKAHLEKIKVANKFIPELPKTFDAELRPYQIDGYNWLSRLANWGVGACLADDMGLGKTVMALGLLVERAEQGAALVVAPLSVCRNWIKEAQKFAPTLKFQLFGEGDRKSQVENLGKYDVLVTSYNLLQIEEELFTAQKFATIVLDEAQAVKNRTTKRSKTVMNLQGDFRLITTGTPIENHLGELWNLFNFINPAMLGSHDFFNERFALPIEKNKDENSRKTLQRLIKPFVLRRRKNQVLDDLPEKTEIVLTVEMSPEERAFYEATRLEALEKIESQDGDAKDKRFRILAELTRLRLACCHPKLVNENVPLSSSKLELFGETLDELLENRHKALVFSQFVKHLSIVEEYLKSKGITYYYLDGSTPPNVRQERIDAFQRGSGDVFLISLKAGGTGLNLTAADYVIHLDPWWNPAVEDQASDRAHRIGQQRPVTVYRLVTEDTVEEKILKLHETKRDLADSLLDGTDTSGKLSAEDLLALISEV
jgi:SNF2 family DNA or RNA helicase